MSTKLPGAKACRHGPERRGVVAGQDIGHKRAAPRLVAGLAAAMQARNVAARSWLKAAGREKHHRRPEFLQRQRARRALNPLGSAHAGGIVSSRSCDSSSSAEQHFLQSSTRRNFIASSNSARTLGAGDEPDTPDQPGPGRAGRYRLPRRS